jgi:hypothetical protein
MNNFYVAGIYILLKQLFILCTVTHLQQFPHSATLKLYSSYIFHNSITAFYVKSDISNNTMFSKQYVDVLLEGSAGN